tara:strand:- start:160 stop:336 length:177 start_codon:yes stop_codon:yes gene_type:complete
VHAHATWQQQAAFDGVGFLTKALTEGEISSVMKQGLMQRATIIDPMIKLSTRWGALSK